MTFTATMKTIPLRDNKPKQHLVYVGGKEITVKSSNGETKWTWGIWRRGAKSSKTQTVSVKSKRYKSKKWSKKSKKVDHLLKLVTTTTKGRTTTFKIIDRGPKYVTQDRNRRYRVMASGLYNISQGFDTFAKAEAHVNEYIKKQRAEKVKEPIYVLMRPNEPIAYVKQKSGFKTLADAKHSMDKQVEEKKQFVSEGNKTIKKMIAEQRKPDPTLRQWGSLSKSFIRTRKNVLNKDGLKIEVLGFTKRVDTEARKPMELLAVRQVKWTMSVHGKKRTQSASFQLTRWGFGMSTRPAWLPSYTVTNIEGKDVHFTNRQGEKGEDEVHEESLEKVVYTAKPIKKARAELENQVDGFLKSLQQSHKADWDAGERKVNTGTYTEKFSNYSVVVTAYGLKRGYPSIGTTSYKGNDDMRLIGGAVVEAYKKGSRKVSDEHEWQIIRPKSYDDRKSIGRALLITRRGGLVGSYRSVDSARTALRKLVNDTVYTYNK